MLAASWALEHPQHAHRWNGELNKSVGNLLRRYRQSELVHARWAMLGVAGVLVQEIVKPDIFFYEAGLPQNLPEPFKNINMCVAVVVEKRAEVAESGAASSSGL